MTKRNFTIPFVYIFISSYSWWISIAIISLTIISIIAQRIYTWQPELLPSQIIIGLSTSLIPLAIKINQRKIELIAPILEDITRENSRKEQLLSKIKSFENSAWSNIFPIAVTLLGSYTLYIFGSPWRFTNPLAHSAFSIFVIVFFFVAGAIGWQYVFLLVILYSASKLDIIADIFAWPARQVKKINQIIIEIYFAGALIYIGAILSIGALPWGIFLLTNDNLFTRLWVFPVALIVISYFLALQYFIHRILVTSKDIRLEKIDAKLEKLIDTKNMIESDINIKFISELIGWRKKIESESEWPFNFQTSLGVISSVLIPTIASISDMFTRFFGK